MNYTNKNKKFVLEKKCSMRIIDENVIKENTVYDLNIPFIRVNSLLSYSKEVEVLDINKGVEKWLNRENKNEKFSFREYLKSQGYQLIKIKE